MRLFKHSTLILLLLLTTLNLQAKWWIFGGSDDAVTIDYLYANSHNFDDFAEQIVLYSGALKGEPIHIRGKATATAGSIAKVMVSLDDKKSWQKAKLAKDGSFDFTFEPQIDETYDIYVKAMDTAVKSNDVDATHKKLKIMDGDIYAFIEKTLQALKEAYQAENGPAFMSYVSDNFTSDPDTLNIALRKDFTLLEDISIDFSINSVAEADGHYYASVRYNRRVISTKTGENFHDLGVTEFGFTLGKKGALLYSMKNPLIFGVSDPENVAQGSVLSSENGNVLIVNDDNSLTTGPVSVIGQGGGMVRKGIFTLGIVHQYGYRFVDDTYTENSSGADIYQNQDTLMVINGNASRDLGMVGLESIDRAPSEGYQLNAVYDQLSNPKYDGHTIALKLNDGNYALIEIQPGYTLPPPGGGYMLKQYRYKYNPNHSPRF